MAMLENVPDLTLEFLNEATQAWIDFEYNRKIHSGTGQTPLARWIAGPEVMRPSPDSAALARLHAHGRRTQRRSDGTVVIDTRRFEVPSAFAISIVCWCVTRAGTCPRCTWSTSTRARCARALSAR